jgi:hypothetical protein
LISGREQHAVAVVAAHEHEQVDLGDLDLGDRVVDRGVGDVIAALGEAVAQLGRVRRVDEFHREAALGVVALGQRRVLHQVGQAGEDHDLQRGLLRLGRGSRKGEGERCDGQPSGHCHGHGDPPVDFT